MKTKLSLNAEGKRAALRDDDIIHTAYGVAMALTLTDDDDDDVDDNILTARRLYTLPRQKQTNAAPR